MGNSNKPCADLKVGRISGPVASQKSTTVPIGIRKQLGQQHAMFMFCVMPNFKVDRVRRTFNDQGLTRGSTIHACSYEELIRSLRVNGPATATATSSTWTPNLMLARRILFLLQLDLEVSVQCAVALVETMSWASRASGRDPINCARVLVMSWGHPFSMVDKILSSHRSIDLFGLPDPERKIRTHKYGGDLQQIIHNIDRVGGTHSIVRFESDALPNPNGWTIDMDKIDVPTNLRQVKDRHIIQMNTSTSMSAQLTGTDYIHIVGSKTRAMVTLENAGKMLAKCPLSKREFEQQKS